MADGEIDRVLRGRIVDHAYTDGGALVLQTRCGQWVHIVWEDEPTLKKCDVKIALPPAKIITEGGAA